MITNSLKKTTSSLVLVNPMLNKNYITGKTEIRNLLVLQILSWKYLSLVDKNLIREIQASMY